jgi:ABC-type branched-subunit amino acid transport system permease subunit
LFYGIIVLALVLTMKPWWRLALVAVGTVVFGFAAHALATAIDPSWTNGAVIEGGRLAGAISDWVIIPTGHDRFANAAYIALIVAVLTLTRIHGWWRTLLTIPTVYLGAVVWETSFVEEPAVARWILFGALLVVLMTVRPQGLLGTPRVEIV